MTKTEVPGEPGVESSTHDREALQGEDEDAFDTLTEAAVDGELASDFVSLGLADDAAAAPADVRYEDFPPSVAPGEATPAHSDESVAIPVKSSPGPPPPRTNFGEYPEPRATVTGQDATASGLVPSWGLTGARPAGAVAVAGAIATIASILPHSSESRLASVGYRVPVACMSVGVMLLVGLAFRLDRRALLLAATGLGLALFGVTFPMSWPPGPLPGTAGFWLGACGAALAASGAAVAAWLAYSEAPTAEVDASGPTQSRMTRALLALPGPLIVIGSLFILGEWGCKRSGCTNPTTWAHWTSGIHRYPSAVILLCGLVIALAVAGIWVNRRRLLVMGAAVSCLVLGEAVPLIYLDRGELPWGSGRWLRIAGAVVAVAGLAAAAAATGRDAPASQRYG
jgi:hypothetical protein